MKTALKTAGYFENLEEGLKAQANSKNSSNEAEYLRAKKELDDLTRRFNTLLMNQGQMTLDADALRFMSEQLNLIAKQKRDLENYIQSLKYAPISADAFKQGRPFGLGSEFVGQCFGRRKKW